MMQLGADPFSTGKNGKLQSAEQLAIERNSAALMQSFADIKSSLRAMVAEEEDEAGLSAWANSTSAEAIDFFQDLGIKEGTYMFDHIQSAVAINQWLRRNPSEIEYRVQPGLSNHALRGASAQVIGAYVDAIRMRPSFDAEYQGDVNSDLRIALGWHKVLSDLERGNQGMATLFNFSASVESAKALLLARISAKPGDLQWNKFCENEWEYILGNVEDTSDAGRPSVRQVQRLHGVTRIASWLPVDVRSDDADRVSEVELRGKAGLGGRRRQGKASRIVGSGGRTHRLYLPLRGRRKPFACGYCGRGAQIHCRTVGRHVPREARDEVAVMDPAQRLAARKLLTRPRW
jgi:hypothetical protein